jgi:hypothetical protein
VSLSGGWQYPRLISSGNMPRRPCSWSVNLSPVATSRSIEIPLVEITQDGLVSGLAFLILRSVLFTFPDRRASFPGIYLRCLTACSLSQKRPSRLIGGT